jgi:hypothetical protein
MDHDTMHLRIAGWLIELRVSPAMLAGEVAARYAAFAAEKDEAPDFSVEVHNEPPGGTGETRSESILQAQLTPEGEDFLLDSPQVYGMIDTARGRATLRMRSDSPSREAEYFLRIALALFALPRGGLLIHCAALKRSDLVYLFVGQSGSGKSTVVRLSHAAERAIALGDDLIMIRRECDAWQAYGTPFWNLQTGDRGGQQECGRVAQIYKLVQDRSVFVEPMGGAAATAELIANCPVVNDQLALLPGLIDRCRSITAAIPVARLHFRKDDTFWDVID